MTEPAAPAVAWHRLDPRMLAVGPLRGVGQLLPLIAVLLITGRDDRWRLWGTVAVIVLVIVFAVIRWRTTRYRITDERVELHSGLFNRQHRSVPLDRIRTVDLTARLLHRAFGLSVVRIGPGTGDPYGDARGVILDAVRTAEAERMRAMLLPRARQQVPRPGAESPATELARFDVAWVRFAPLTATAVIGVGVLLSAGYNLVENLGLRPRDLPGVDVATRVLSGTPVWLTVLAVAGGLVLVGMFGAVLVYLERWWDYRLVRQPDGDLLMRRGLLTRRSLTIAQQRIRGAEIVESILLRAGRGGQARALAAGLSRDTQGGAISPPAPVAEVHRVAGAALRQPAATATRAPLARHPRAALRRRLSRALLPALLLVAAVWVAASAVPALSSWLWPAALLVLPAAVALALDRYRNLGHALLPGYLVSRHGSVLRRTVALQRRGIIGWRVRQSLFQRRAGLVTLEATTAAGRGGYPVIDVDPARMVELITATTPDAVAELLGSGGIENAVMVASRAQRQP